MLFDFWIWFQTYTFIPAMRWCCPSHASCWKYISVPAFLYFYFFKATTTKKGKKNSLQRGWDYRNERLQNTSWEWDGKCKLQWHFVQLFFASFVSAANMGNLCSCCGSTSLIAHTPSLLPEYRNLYRGLIQLLEVSGPITASLCAQWGSKASQRKLPRLRRTASLR